MVYLIENVFKYDNIMYLNITLDILEESITSDLKSYLFLKYF